MMVMTRRNFWSKALGGLSVGVGVTVVGARVGKALPLVGHGGIVPMYFVDPDHGKDHSGFPYQDCPHKTLDFMNKDSRRHRQWMLYTRKSDSDVDPKYAEAWDEYFDSNEKKSWSELR